MPEEATINRQLSRLLIAAIVIMLAIAGSFLSVHPVHAACLVFSGVGGQTFTYPLDMTHSYTDTYTVGGVTTSLTNNAGATVSAYTYRIPINYTFESLVDNTCTPPASASAPGPVPIFTDGRINNMPPDAAQTAAIYCSNGGVTIWSVDNQSIGKFAFTATAAEIAKVPANPDKNTLIKQALNIALYRLHGGKMQVNAPNGYVYIWTGC